MLIEKERTELFCRLRGIDVYKGRAFLPADSTEHEEIEIKYIVSGRVHMLIGKDVVYADEGDVIFVNPYEHYSDILNAGGCCCHIKIVPSALGIDELFIPERSSGQRVKHLIKNPSLVKIIKSIVNECERQDAYFSLAVDGLIREAFAVILRNELSEGTATEESKLKGYKTIEPAVIARRDDYKNTYTGEELSNMCSLTSQYFCRLFKKVMGITPVQFQTECRLTAAETLMKDKKMNMSEVASRVGFEDASYFSRVYRNSRGMSPRQARTKLS